MQTVKQGGAMKRVQVVVDLPEWAAAALEAAPWPVDLCGATVAERLAYLAVEYADLENSRVQGVAKRQERRKLYDKLGVPFPTPPHLEDDDIPF